MRRSLAPRNLLVVAILLLLTFAGTAQAEFTPVAGWDKQLFPSFIVATATLRLPEDANDWDDEEDDDMDDDDAADEDAADEDAEMEADDDEESEADDEEESEADDEEESEADDEEDKSDEAACEEVEDAAEGDDADDAGEQDTNLLGDSQGLLGIRIESPGEDTPITVTVTSDSILEPSTFRGTLESKGAVYAIFPKVKYRYDVLSANKQSIPVPVTFRVELGDEDADEQTVTMTLRSVNDCPYAVVRADGDVADISFMFAAYVNEEHPFVDKVLREALDGGVVDSFTGYQSGDAAEVFRQVYALWHALSRRDVRYSNITVSAAESTTVYSQHVRLIDESINNAQANCVDGSVLLASLLRKVDIEPVLVSVPGHCYLAFYADQAKQHLIGLETTLLGSEGDEESPATIEGVDGIVDEEWSNQPSWSTFRAAVAMGSEGLRENQAKFEADADYQLIEIAAARRLGVLPIAFDQTEDFETAAADEE